MASSFFNDAKGATSQAPDAPDTTTVNPVTGSRAVPQTKQKVGHECEFVECPPKQFQSECSICLLILRDPHIISCCGHSFCEACIGRIREDGKPCPLCNKPGYTTLPNQGLQRALNDFDVSCSHRELGCEWVGKLGSLDGHLNAEPQPDCQLVGCQFVELKCIHCKTFVRRLAIAVHQNVHCPKRPYTCEYCEEYESTFENITSQHYVECKRFLLLCPNNCSPEGSGIERQALDHHIQEDCPLTIVDCSLRYAGCDVRLPRKELESHMREDSSSHVALLAAENQRMTKQLLEKDDRVQESIQQFTKENADLRSCIDEMKQELASYRQHTTQELAGSVDTLQHHHQQIDEVKQKLTKHEQQTASLVDEVEAKLKQEQALHTEMQQKFAQGLLTTSQQHTAKEIDTLKQNFAKCQLTISQLEEKIATLKEKHTPKAKDPVIVGASDVSWRPLISERASYRQLPSTNSPVVGDAPSKVPPQWQRKYSERHHYQPQPSTSSPVVRPDAPSKRRQYQLQTSTSSPVVRDAPSSKAAPVWRKRLSDWQPK